jgi:hypothetical protein
MNPLNLNNIGSSLSLQSPTQLATQPKQFLPTVTSATPPPTTVDASTLGTTSTVNLQPKTTVPPPDITTMIGSTPAPTETVAPTESKAPSLLERFSGLLGGASKEQATEDKISAETEPYKQQLNEIETQIKTQQAKAIQNQELAMQRGETLGFASREAQSIARTDAIETLKLSALAEGMRGNIALAEDRATRAINAQYAEKDKEIETARQNIYDNYDSFTAAEKKRADATLLKLDKDDAFVKEQKEDAKITQGFLQEAIAQSAQNGTPIPSLILQRANQSKTPTEALQILAPYMIDANAKQKALLDLQNQRLQNQKLTEDISKTRAEKEKILKESTSSVDAKTQLQNNEALSLAKELRKADAIGKGSALGASFAKLVPFGQSLGLQGNRTAFEAKVDSLKANLTLDNLKLLKGAMSDKDLLFLNSIGSSLNTGMSEAAFDTELDRVITKLESAGATTAGTGAIPKGTDGSSYGYPGYVSDGTQWILKK